VNKCLAGQPALALPSRRCAWGRPPVLDAPGALRLLAGTLQVWRSRRSPQRNQLSQFPERRGDGGGPALSEGYL
jgi:hypothetical protein